MHQKENANKIELTMTETMSQVIVDGQRLKSNSTTIQKMY